MEVPLILCGEQEVLLSDGEKINFERQWDVDGSDQTSWRVGGRTAGDVNKPLYCTVGLK